jgi:hypothetical protein
LAVPFLAYNAFANLTTAVWMLFDKTPLGLLDLPNVATDFVLHIAITAISVAIVGVELRRGRAEAPARAIG